MRATKEQIQKLAEEMQPVFEDVIKEGSYRTLLNVYGFTGTWWEIFHRANKRLENERSMHYWYNLGFNDATLWTAINAASRILLT